MSKTTDYLIEVMNGDREVNPDLVVQTSVTDRVVPILYLIRGLPGSGKTTYANSLGCIVIAPSDMMSRRGGQYKWVAENYMVSKMHFREVVKRLMSLQIDIAITELMVDMRFINFWLDLAKDYYYKVEIKTLVVDPEIALQRNIHQVDHRSIYEVHNQFDYTIPDQVIDFSQGDPNNKYGLLHHRVTS